MTDTQKPKQKKRRFYKNKRSPGPKSPNSKDPSSKSSKNRRPKALSPAKIVQKYDNLMEQYVISRKKFFEMHGRAKGKSLSKIVDNYKRSLKALFQYETTLNDWQKEALEKKTQFYPEDNQYSKEHDLPIKALAVPLEGDFDDPHYLETQRSSSYKNDTEESSGTIEDYKKYKEA